MGDLEQRVKVRLAQMEAAPQMWALTVEGFAMQLVVMGEFLGFTHNDLLEPLRYGSSYRHMADEITNEMATKLIAHFRKVTCLT